MLSIIVAVDSNNGIGIDNEIPWYIPNDFKWFKEHTLNKTVVMGTNTFLSLPEKVRPLPNRTNIILCNRCNINCDGILTMSTKEEIIKYSKDNDVFIIGGGSIYKLFIDDIDKLYLTTINKEFQCDTFFPEINNNDWDIEYDSGSLEYNDLEYNLKIMKRYVR